MPTITALDRWEGRAAHLRRQLGLDPASFAVLAKDMNLSRKANADAIAAMGNGRQIREARASVAGDAGDQADAPA